MRLTVEYVAAQRGSLRQAGFRPVPVYNAVFGDKNTGKKPWGEAWQIVALSPDPLPTPRAEALNTGILCNGLRAIDLDIDNLTLAVACQEAALRMLGATLRRFRANSPRCLLLYRAADGEPHKITLAGKRGKIEVLGHGNQFVAFGRHFEGADLEWEPHPPGIEVLDEVPTVTEAAVAGFLQHCAPIIDATWEQRTNGKDHAPNETLAADPLRVAAAMSVVPNSGPANWDNWNYWAMALWAATQGTPLGGLIMDAWSARNPAYDPAEVKERWNHLPKSPPNRIGAGTIFDHARKVWERAPGRFPWDKPADIEPETGRPLSATPFDLKRALAHKKRAWVYGHFLIRRFLSVLGAPGGIGKTAYAMTVGISVALNQPLLDEVVHEPGPVWIYNLEDPEDELDRRVLAIAQQHGIDPKRLENRLYLDNGRDKPLVIATRLETGQIIATPLVDELITELKHRGIKLLIVDPFVKSHRLEENRNEQIDFAATQWGRIAEAADCAILLVHHFRKGSSDGSGADAFRGASALIDAARAAVMLTVMTEAEASQFGIDEADRKLFLRLDNAKLNLARAPVEVPWLELCSVTLANGDNVQAARRWDPPAALDGISMSMIVRIMDKLHAGPGDGEQYTLTRRGADNSRWAGIVVMEIAGQTDKQAAAALRTWAGTKLIVAGRYHSPKRRKEAGGLFVNLTRLTEMRQQAAAGIGGDGY